MNRLDQFVVSEVVALFGSAVDDPQESVLDQVNEDLLEQGSQILIDGVHLENGDLILSKQFVHDVHGRNGSDVSCPQHESDPTGSVGIVAIDDSLGFGEILRGNARLHPDLSLDTRPQQSVKHVGGEYSNDRLSLAGRHRARELRAAMIEDVLQGVPQQTSVANGEVRAGVPLLGGHRIIERNALGRAGKSHPPLGHCSRLLHNRIEIPDPLLNGGLRPGPLGLLQPGQEPIDFRFRGYGNRMPPLWVDDTADRCDHEDSFERSAEA